MGDVVNLARDVALHVCVCVKSYLLRDPRFPILGNRGRGRVTRRRPDAPVSASVN
jgi:hypothetical protein